MLALLAAWPQDTAKSPASLLQEACSSLLESDFGDRSPWTPGPWESRPPRGLQATPDNPTVAVGIGDTWGSGALLWSGRVATSHSLVEPGIAAWALEGKEPVITIAGLEKEQKALVVAVSPQSDLAILKLVSSEYPQASELPRRVPPLKNAELFVGGSWQGETRASAAPSLYNTQLFDLPGDWRDLLEDQGEKFRRLIRKRNVRGSLHFAGAIYRAEGLVPAGITGAPIFEQERSGPRFVGMCVGTHVNEVFFIPSATIRDTVEALDKGQGCVPFNVLTACTPGDVRWEDKSVSGSDHILRIHRQAGEKAACAWTLCYRFNGIPQRLAVTHRDGWSARIDLSRDGRERIEKYWILHPDNRVLKFSPSSSGRKTTRWTATSSSKKEMADLGPNSLAAQKKDWEEWANALGALLR